MNLLHVHLLLNHVPTIGTIIALGLLLLAFARRSEELERASFALFFAIALASIPTYVTGYAAQNALKNRPGISQALIDLHQSAALLALMLMEVTGVVAWFGIWQARRPSGSARWTTPAVLLLSVVTIVVMASAANIGGKISHPEIVVAGETPEAGGVLAPSILKSVYVAKFQFQHPWAWPMLETLHFIGLSLLFGIVILGNLRILGMMRSAPLIDIHRLLPWGLWGFVINAVTGMMFFVGAAGQYFDNPAFHLKLVCMLLAGANVLYLTLFDDIWTLKAGEHAPLSVRLVAVSQVFLWIGVIYFGRMLPYLGDAF